MKNLELSDEAYAILQQLAAVKRLSLSATITALLGPERTVCGDHLRFHLANGTLAQQPDSDERYLSLLAWVARHHPADFADFISHQDSARRYLMLSRADVQAIRRQHHTRQIEGTPCWAVMNIDSATKSRFVRRLLEFIGCHDETVTEAIRVLALPAAGPDYVRLLSVA